MFRRLGHTLILISLLVGLIPPAAASATPARAAHRISASAGSAPTKGSSSIGSNPSARPALRSNRPPADFVPAPLRAAAAPAAPSEAAINATATPSPAQALFPNTRSFPLVFTPNAGQTDSAVRYLVRGGAGALVFATDETVLALPDANRVLTPTTVRLHYLNANPAPQVRAGARLPGV